MTGVEIALVLVGVLFVLASFFVQEKLSPKDVQEITRLSEKELKVIVERELRSASEKVEETIDNVAGQAQEDAKRAMEKESNEKIMAINDYSNTVIESMNKTHNEILFLYNMLNDKHTELAELASKLQQFAEQMRHTQAEVMNNLAEAAKDSEQIREQNKAEVQEQEKVHTEQTVQHNRAAEEKADIENFNNQVLALHQSGVSDVEIARQLGRGLGEVKLVIGLYKGEDVSEI